MGLKLDDKLKQLYQAISILNDEIPAQMARKITLYCEVLQIIGRLHAAAVREHGKAYADRKRIWGETILTSDGTAKDKEGAAEVSSYQARIIEAEAEQEVTRWKQAFISTQEIVQALKIEHKTLMKEYGDSC